MVVRTFFDKNNTIISNTALNTGLNPVAELFYGGPEGEQQYSRMLFHFDVDRLIDLYTGGTYTDITKLRHTLKLTNTSSYDDTLLNESFGDKARATSFDLVVFTLSQDWDEGVGYDYVYCSSTVGGDCVNSTRPSNWTNAQTGIEWDNGSGTYSGSPTGITIATQHFDHGNENLEVDITDYVNGLITGDTNYGLGIAYVRGQEVTTTTTLQYVGFFTRHTQTVYEPHVETLYDNHIIDDRNNFFLDKPNKLYLYVNAAGNPVNLDSLPRVDVYDNNDEIFSSYTGTQITHVTKGVYSIDITVPTTDDYIENTMFNDKWSGITINGIQRPVVSLDFALKSSDSYYNIGAYDLLPKKVGLSVAGLRSKERIKRGDVRKVIVSARIPYTVDQTQTIDDMEYRIYAVEGKNELTVVDYQPIERANNHSYFLLDTGSLLPNQYYLDVKVTSNQEVTTLKDVISFEIVSESNLRKSQ